MPHLSPTTLTTDEQRLILRATADNVRDHTIISLALGTGLPQWEYATSLRRGNRPGPRRVVTSFWMCRDTHSPYGEEDVARVSQLKLRRELPRSHKHP
jgi:hypothetical protein